MTLVSDAQRTLQPDPVIKRPLRPRCDQHQARLIDEVAIEVHRACYAVPGFDAQERGAARH